MQHVRRLARGRFVAAVAVTLCAGFALTGCRSQPSVAAYAGGQSLTEKQVDSIIEDANGKLKEGTKVPTRDAVVATFALSQACEQVRSAKTFALNPVNTDELAASEQVPATSQYAKDRAAMYGCMRGLTAVEQGAEGKPTDAELHDIYRRAKAAGYDGTFEKLATQLSNDTTVQQYLGFSRLFTDMVNKGDVTVNPRYRPLEFPLTDLNSGVPLIVIAIEPGSDAVRNLS